LSEPTRADAAPSLRPTWIEWFALAACLLLTVQYAWVLDDAYIYSRYVDNLVHLGRGLVFNEGEYVEGYSSPLWCLLLIPLRAIGLNWWAIVRLIGLASAAGTWWLLVALARRTTPTGARPINVAALLLYFNYAVLTYFTSGVESPLVQLAAAAFALFVFDPRCRTAAVIVGLSPMIRHELALPLAIALVWAWRSTGRFPRWATLTAIATLAPWLLFRVWYYADIVPNTFYLKDEVNWARGLRYVHDTARSYGVYVLAPAFVLLALVLRRSGAQIQSGARWVLLLSSAVVTLYVMKIGGDPRHYRYLAFPFCVLACASQGLLEHAALLSGRRAGKFATLASLCIAGGMFALYPRQLSHHPIARDAEHVKVDEINDAQYHRLHPDLDFDPWTLSADDELLDDIALDLIWGEDPLLPPAPSTMRIEYARWRASGESSASLPVGGEGWCIHAWLRFRQTLIHKDGLTDPILARAKVPSRRAAHKPGLRPLTLELCRIRQQFGSSAGACRAAVDSGEAPTWVVDNIDAIDAIERKAFNRHDLLENFGLLLRGRLSFDKNLPEDLVLPGATLDSSPPR